MQNDFTPQHGGAEDEIDLREIWILLRRGRWLILACAALALVLTAALTLRTAPVYEAATLVRIDEKQSSLPVLDILQTAGAGSEIATEMEILRTHTLAEEVVDSLGLRLRLLEPGRLARSRILDFVRVAPDASPAEYTLERGSDNHFTIRDRANGGSLGPFAPGEPIDLAGATLVLAPGAAEHRRLRVEIVDAERAARALLAATTISRPNREANIVVVRHQHTDTELVRTTPNTLARLFIERRRELKKTEARSTITFLQEQIDTLTRQLTSAEDALQRFRESGQIVSLEAEASTQVRELAQLQAQRNQIDAERAALAALLSEVQAITPTPGDPSPYRRLMAFPSLLRNQAASELLRSLTVVENERTEILMRRTMKDPDAQILTGRIHELEEQLRVIAVTYLQGLGNQVASLDATLKSFGTQLARIPAKEVQLARLARQTGVLEEINTLLQTRLKEAEIAQAVEDISVRIVDPARAPNRPIKPRKPLNLMLGMMLGLMLGVGVVFLREFMDSTIRTREDMQALAGVPVLGLIPRIPEAVRANGHGSGSGRPRRTGSAGSGQLDALAAHLITGRDPRSPISEAYRGLRTNITFARPESPARTLVFTSPAMGDGKSTTSANLATVLAQQGLRVLLVDADLRRGFLHTVFGTDDRESGLSNVLLGTIALEEATRTLDLGASGALDFLSTGTLPPNPVELLGSERMRELLARAERSYDMVILDAPPLTLVTDAAVLGTKADGVVVISRAGRTQKAALSYAMEQLHHVRAPVLGAVLNDVDFKRDGYYGGYGYQYYYGTEGEERRGLRGVLARLG
jgi:tyrosine-protein kinase Etk/Wzc